MGPSLARFPPVNHPPIIIILVQVAPTSVRGTLGSLNQLMICLGILAALVVNVALPVTSWRTMFMLAVVPAALLFLGESTFTPRHV